MTHEEYKLIPFNQITDEARNIAVAWVENYTPYGSTLPEIAQKHKLASDIMNYAKAECAAKDARIMELERELKLAKNLLDHIPVHGSGPFGSNVYPEGFNEALKEYQDYIFKDVTPKDKQP